MPPGKFCEACQAIPAQGWCSLADCPNAPSPDWKSMLEVTASDLEGPLDDLAWFSALGKPGTATRLALARDIRSVLTELKRCHEVIGAYVVAGAYADALPDDAKDEADLKFGQHYWEGAAVSWAGDDLLSAAPRAAVARMRLENPAQVRDIEWSRAMEDVVASGGLPRDGEDPA